MTWPQVLESFLRAAFLSTNGSTTLSLLKTDLVDRLGVLTPGDYAAGVAVGAASPGPLGYGAIALGYLADGWRGALVATFTSWLPAFFAIPLRALHRRWEEHPWLKGISWGVSASGAGLLAALCVSLTLHALQGWTEAALGAAALALLFRKVHPVIVLAVSATVGALLLR